MSKSRAKAPAKATTKTTSSPDEEDSSMMGEYFQKYKEYKNKFGDKNVFTMAMW